MMQGLLNDGPDRGQAAPSMMGFGANSLDFSGYNHHTEIFMIGGQDSEDEIAAYDALMNRILSGELILRIEKESISNVTGVSTTIVKYYSTRTEGATNA